MDRSTGTETPVLVDATSEDAARGWAIDEGHLVGRVIDTGPANVAYSSSPPTRRPAAPDDDGGIHLGSGAPSDADEQRRQEMIDAARQWQRQRTSSGASAASFGASGGGGGGGELAEISRSLKAIAESRLVCKPRRTLLMCVVGGLFIGSTITTVLTTMVQIAMTGAASNLTRAAAVAIPTPSAPGNGTQQAPMSIDPQTLAIFQQMMAQKNGAGGGALPGAPGAGVSPEQMKSITDQLDALKKLYEETANNPMGDK
ncbi:MAG: hypothetical protein K2X32_06805 [Phycisphaerales bacterium]|nr:hypothetical protein [Phycisphaerales bacterium]